jgi:ATPase subunit of ABC transporter with duplicated ATPase domains
MEEPDILLLDEPTNDLDIQTLQWLEGFISESRIPVLYVSHDETLIENTANVIIHMEQLAGKTKCRISVVHCSYRDYLSHRRSNFEHQEQVAKKQREDYDKQMEKWRQIYNRVDHEQEVISRQDPGGARLLKKKMHSVLSMGKRFEREKENFDEFPQQEDAILAKFDESIRLPKGKTVLDFSCRELRIGERVLTENINLQVLGNEHIGITGRNGVGKSTLLARLWGELRSRKDIIAAYMPQHYSDMLDFEKTPIEYLAANYAKDDVTKARTFMGSMRFTREEMSRKIGGMSCGQQAKILFLDMILRKANVLLLDEPTRNFSPLSCPVVRAALNRFGGAIISVSHDRKFLKEVCDKVYVLDDKGLSVIDMD